MTMANQCVAKNDLLKTIVAIPLIWLELREAAIKLAGA